MQHDPQLCWACQQRLAVGRTDAGTTGPVSRFNGVDVQFVYKNDSNLAFFLSLKIEKVSYKKSKF